jgi:dTMP kinase
MRESRVVTRGLLLTFEGIEGCGKTTQLNRAAEWLASRGRVVLATREPGGTALGQRLRHALLHAREKIEPGAELLLLVADRRQHLLELIEPALAEGTDVLCDRYIDSSRAYQGAGRRLGEESVDALHRRWCPRVPDRTYLFDCPVETALRRVAQRSRAGKDKIEREEIAFHRRVRAAYRRRARSEPSRFRVIDASGTPVAVFKRLERDLEALFSTRHPRPARRP